MFIFFHDFNIVFLFAFEFRALNPLWPWVEVGGRRSSLKQPAKNRSSFKQRYITVHYINASEIVLFPKAAFHICMMIRGICLPRECAFDYVTCTVIWHRQWYFEMHILFMSSSANWNSRTQLNVIQNLHLTLLG